MKMALCFTLTLLTFVTLAFVPNSSAQDNASGFIVQIIYFVPKDREPDPDMGTKMDTLIKEIKQFYADEMERHGFGSKTFSFETDGNGDAKVHQVIGEYNDTEYVNRNQTGSQEIQDQFDTSTTRNILIMVLDYSSQLVCGRAGFGGGYGGGGFVIVPASGDCFSFKTIAHELGHGFGLYHDFRSSEYMMSYGADRNKLSYCSAEFLNVSRYFNPGSEGYNFANSNVQLLTSSFVSRPANIRLRFEVTDPDGLHQAQLMIPDDNLSVVDCKSLDGQTATVEFVTDELHDTNSIALIVVDVLGNFSWKSFTIDITDLLPSPEAISIPDSNLATAIKDELDLASDSHITTLNILDLERLIAQNKQIADLTGLEHATNLRTLTLSGNQIEDITSLTRLKQLRHLNLRENAIRDVTPLTGLTNLTWLTLGDNQISDIAPLAGLTELATLQLWNNQISDVSSLTGLTNLVELHLIGNPIRNREPLLTIQSQNPNANIYIDPVVPNRAPVFTDSPRVTRTVLEDAEAGTNIGSPISATDADNDTLTYTLGGTDVGSFDIDRTSGQLKTKAGVELDFETKPSYTVTVTATDSGGLTDTITVDINVEDIDESTEAKAISIPDPNLAAAIRDELDLAPGNPISTRNILDLVRLIAQNKQITDLTGLEHATNLRTLTLSGNQIEDITSLTRLKQLRHLNLRENAIRDVTPLTGLTNLTWLTLGDNQISDIAPLAGLTELATLQLWNNQISDVSSLTGLTNLVELHLIGNPIRNREPLLTIQNQNPNANIYIDPVVPNRAPVFTDSPRATRTVLEGAETGTNIGSPISATDADNDTLTYTLGGTDVGSFDIDRTSGQLKTKVGVELDFDTKPSYTVTVTVTDSEGLTATITVDINVEDIDESVDNNPPVFSDGGRTTRLIPEDAEVGANIGRPVTAIDSDTGDTLTYTLGGTDADSFDIDRTSGQLKTKVGVELDFDTKPSYTVTVTATDTEGLTDTITVDINVEDIDESTEAKAISIPDPNLAAAIRDELDLAPGNPISTRNILDLVRLIAQNKQIADLTGLEHATNLKTLSFRETQIKDITLLAQLTSLSDLYLGDNQISNVTPLAELTRLQTLRLWNNQISDIRPLSKLTNLERLHLAGNQIRDIRPLSELTNLKYLYLQNNQINDIEALAKLTNLEELTLNDNQISDVTALTGLKQLIRLELWNTQISNVTPLAGLTNLERLVLVGNPITNREPLLTLLRRNPNVKIFLKNHSEPLPVTLSYFRAEHTKAGIILKWTTESEVDNAGFYIYRSPTKDGKFKVVNPKLIQGAGTTGERQTYTWTDATAKPNTVYYYRIEDVSHAGVRQQLATVRMRGFVSASGKFTTRWADLKANN